MQQVGKYLLVRKLATGGMAEVFLAKAAGPMGFEKTLVLKRILPHLAEEPAFVEMFLSEAKLAAQLTHPNIVQIFDFGEADGAYFLAMEYIDGPNLRTLVKRATALGQPLPPAVCARIIAQACEGLAFAHDFSEPETGEALGLVHRDISPDNLLLSRQGAVKVVDFGIAKAAGQSHRTQSGIVKGKVAYMPPEQLRAHVLDRRVDVYALGVVLYELLTAHKPFAADSDVALMQAILFDDAVPAAHWRPELPEALLRILERALAKDREQRYPDCLALQSDLEEFILSGGRPVTTQQLAQLIAQLTAGTEQPVPTPQPGTPRSGPKAASTPVHTPAPNRTRTDGEGRQQRPTVKTPRPQALREGAQEAEPPPETPPATVQLSPPVEKTVMESRRRSWRLPALVGGVLLALGGGTLLWRTASAQGPEGPAGAAQSETSPGGGDGTHGTGGAGVTYGSPDGGGSKPPESPDAGTKPPETPDAGTKPPESPDAGTKPPESLDAGTKPPESLDAGTKGPAGTRKPPPPPPPRLGKVEFRIRPYATVIVDGKTLGDTPLPHQDLSAGRHTVKLVNESIPKTVIKTIEVKPSQVTILKVNLHEE